MNKLIIIGVTLLSTTLLSAQAPKELNAALKLSSLGYGVDISTPINETYAVRFNMNGGSYSDSQSSDGNTYEGTLDLFTMGVLVDAYPFENNFRLSTGLYYNGNGFSGAVTPSSTQTVDINGVTYTSADLAKVNTDVTFNKVAPYFGIGWGNDARDKGWGFTFDLGAMYHGSPTADLTAEGVNPAIATQVNNGLAQEEQNVNDDLSDFKLYPVISIGVNRSF